ncbi:hypothetical protein BKA63DRAFT_525004 [Paraphoma chrysanthemicola]|nr:hypothetical protein BKA63DRAFT_525004 [Paraphoma chrysanthemicola]
MSDYGDDYSDYGDEWFYVEDEYMAADDLAEHAVASPPPTAYGDEDMQPDWDRFDYFNDLEYASDGYDDATFQPHDAKDSKVGQKRKRSAHGSRSKKKRKTADGAPEPTNTERVAHSPIVWRSQCDRQPKQSVLADDAQTYSLLRNWRETLAETPRWARGPPPKEESSTLAGASQAADPAELLSPASEVLDDTAVGHGQDLEEIDEEVEEDEEDEEDDLGISQDAIMAALQKQLAVAGGPLSGMDPQQLLQFAMRMATDRDAGDDIAGEMADAMLDGEDDADDGNTEESLLSWVAQQRNATKDAPATAPKSPEVARESNRPPTPPSSEANRSVKAAGDAVKSGEAKSKTWNATETRAAPSLKRKADAEIGVEDSTKTTKKRATRSFDAPTAASQARAAAARPTRATRGKQ